MLLVLAKNILRDGCREEFLAVAKLLVEGTRKEAGCLAYDLAADQENENVYYFVEKYVDAAAFAAHRASEHFQAYVPRLNDYRTGPSQVTVCEVEPF
ncbi:antibiotic biosynthesis monooxygenase [Anaerotignum lactatifermentans]|uniref:Antibiotic biosynthesis monooxygenase n=1 Tax=Anaerotignum lactatifermentans TaxID=160404 RepID=A0ABS2GA37_9FIRM|nr:putative quinol monooxygenase [Anaerotignum lactatifermentans]MBM6829278.1 antibiotic biosynthesis monooxygenase [Anaerotignum lactatifermentans]MBM6877482.1 antibiotic biosynthesis monooxygenase [Anaerotignum lactatifermentans]MBM6950856.1 antibiotic biosynthesis monooxygenase [Anaerotignum lactatifermentans]